MRNIQHVIWVVAGFVALTIGASARDAENHSAAKPSPGDLLKAATTRFGPGENYPVLPSLSTELRGRICNEITRPEIREAFELLDIQHKRNVDWFEAVERLEREQAVWSLHACLVHQSEDVQIEALRALGRLKNKDAVPFLLIYGDYMAVDEGGSENATIHGIIHESIANALSSITGIDVELKRRQDPEGLKRGLRLWAKWLVKQPPSAQQ